MKIAVLKQIVKRVKNTSLLILAVALMLLSAGSIAASASGLLAAKVVVQDQSAAHRQQAIKQAFGDVLVRYSGSTRVLSNSAVKAAIAKPESYISQYQYDTVKDQTVLAVDFQQSAVTDLLRSQKLPVWTERPSIAAWVAIDDSGSRQIISNSNLPKFSEAIEQQALHRGLSMTLPTYDMTDLMKVASADVWQVEEGPIMAASKRYDADGVLIGRVTAKSGGGWSAKWTLINADQRTNFNTQGADYAALLQPAVDKVVDTLSAQAVGVDRPSDHNKAAVVSSVAAASTAAVSTTSVDVGAPVKASVTKSSGRVARGGPLQLSVSGLNSFSDYTGALLYLRSLGPVKSLTPVLVADDHAVFAIKLSGGEEQLWSALSQGGRLQVVDEASVSSSNVSAAVHPARYFNWRR